MVKQITANEAREIALNNQTGYNRDLDANMVRIYDIISQKANFGFTSVILFVDNDWHKGVSERLREQGFQVTMFEYSNDRLSVSW